jgi:hypothetical protein
MIGSGQLTAIWRQLESDLQVVDRDEVPEKIRQAVRLTLEQLHEYQIAQQKRTLSDPLKAAQEISHILDFLRLAVKQRTTLVRYQNRGWFAEWIRRILPGLFTLEQREPNLTQYLNQIEELIQSCYEPFSPFLHTRPGYQRKPIPPDKILAVYFQGEYLYRPIGPVPFLIVPNYLEGNIPYEWTGVGHETGHHVYRQVPGLREELEVTVGRALRNGSVTVNGQSIPITETQQRLWFNYLEESFADTIGVLTLGAAFVYTGHVMIRYYLSDDKLRGIGTRDLTHPVPIIRGLMANYVYERLLLNDPHNPDLTDLHALQQEWQEVINALPGKSLRDPHTPIVKYLVDKWNSSGDLDYDETVAVMRLFVNTMLDSKLESLDCKSISEVLDFSRDERKRMEAVQSLTLGVVLAPYPQPVRIQVAAQRLYQQRAH